MYKDTELNFSILLQKLHTVYYTRHNIARLKSLADSKGFTTTEQRKTFNKGYRKAMSELFQLLREYEFLNDAAKLAGKDVQ